MTRHGSTGPMHGHGHSALDVRDGGHASMVDHLNCPDVGVRRQWASPYTDRQRALKERGVRMPSSLWAKDVRIRVCMSLSRVDPGVVGKSAVTGISLMGDHRGQLHPGEFPN